MNTAVKNAHTDKAAVAVGVQAFCFVSLYM